MYEVWIAGLSGPLQHPVDPPEATPDDTPDDPDQTPPTVVLDDLARRTPLGKR